MERCPQPAPYRARRRFLRTGGKFIKGDGADASSGTAVRLLHPAGDPAAGSDSHEAGRMAAAEPSPSAIPDCERHGQHPTRGRYLNTGMTTSVDSLLEDMARQGVKLWVEGSRLRYSSSRGPLSEELLAKLRENKADLLARL